ncbi:hypothetical protein Tco_0745690 [Tanacetum coccineum]
MPPALVLNVNGYIVKGPLHGRAMVLLEFGSEGFYEAIQDKFEFLKRRYREWNKSNMLSVKNVKAKYKEGLEALEAIIDRGDGNEGIVNKRTEVEEWNESPKAVKGEFFQHFNSRFDEPDASRATINIRYLKTLTYDQHNELESEVSNVKIKRAVWDCGTDKSPGPDGFTFGFYRRFWKIIENDVYDVVKYFFTYGNIPKGLQLRSLSYSLIPKIPEANSGKRI